MLIKGLGKKIAALAAPTEFDKVERAGSRATVSEIVKAEQKYRGAKPARRTRARGKKS
ncbi:MAG: hypothetical protein ACM3U2_14615 [Deltaproteobacteria bacterium]